MDLIGTILTPTMPAECLIAWSWGTSRLRWSPPTEVKD